MLKTASIQRAGDEEESISLRKKWYRRIIIFKDGGLQGWVVNTIWTIFTMVMFGFGFFVIKVREGWVAFGQTYSIIYLGGMAAWFAYKYGKARLEANETTTASTESVAEAIKKVVESMKGGK